MNDCFCMFPGRYRSRRHLPLHLHSDRDYCGSGTEQSSVDAAGLSVGLWDLQTLDFIHYTLKGTLTLRASCWNSEFFFFSVNINFYYVINCNSYLYTCCVYVCVREQEDSTEVFVRFHWSSWWTCKVLAMLHLRHSFTEQSVSEYPPHPPAAHTQPCTKTYARHPPTSHISAQGLNPRLVL